MVLLGCGAGTVIGMIPGLGPITAIAIMTPITYGLDPASGLILMAGVYYAAVFGGSTSSIMIAIGLGATLLRLLDYPLPPLLLAFILGPMLEENLRRSLILYDGSFSFLWQRPTTLIILLVTVGLCAWRLWQSARRSSQ